MKKLIAIFAIVLLSIIGCQEASSVVAPNEGNTLEKKEKANQDSVFINGPGDPAIPRV